MKGRRWVMRRRSKYIYIYQGGYNIGGNIDFLFKLDWIIYM